MGRGGQVGQVAAFEGKFLCFAHSLAFMATFPIGALPQLLKEGKKLLSHCRACKNIQIGL